MTLQLHSIDDVVRALAGKVPGFIVVLNTYETQETIQARLASEGIPITVTDCGPSLVGRSEMTAFEIRRTA